MARNIFLFLVILTLIVLQFSFINPFSHGIAYFNCLIIFLVILAYWQNLIPLLWWSLILGILADLTSAFPFGINLIVILITSFSIYFLINNYFTQRSYFTFLILVFIATVIYNLIFFLAAFLLNFFNIESIYLLISKQFFTGLLWQIFLNLIIALIFYLIGRLLNKLFLKRFLVTK